MEAPVWHVLLTVPVVADGEFLAPRAVADPVEVRPHGGGEQPLQIVCVWQEKSSAKWPRAVCPQDSGPPYGALSAHSPPYCPICGEEREMKESTLCSSITDNSARHTRPPANKTPHWAGLRDSQANSPPPNSAPTYTHHVPQEAETQAHVLCQNTPHQVSDKARIPFWVFGQTLGCFLLYPPPHPLCPRAMGDRERKGQ